MSKLRISELWDKRYGDREEIYDYSGRLMKKSNIGKQNSSAEPTIDHIYPLTRGGKNIEGNIIICHRTTNHEKDEIFNTWKTNGKIFQAVRKKGKRGTYTIKEIKKK